MAANDRRFTRVPPESTGDRINMVHTAEIQFSGGYDQWKIGERYTISGGGGPTMSVHVHGVEGSGTSGHLSVHYSNADKYNEVSPVAGQDITDPDGITLAGTVVSAYDLYIPAQNLMGWDNPSYGANVDRFGSVYTRFTEGPASLSTMGALHADGHQVLADYQFQNSIQPNDFANAQANGATITHNAGKKCVEMTCPTTSGALITHTSNFYHPYVVGDTVLAILSTRLGDSGKANVVRRWGAFDAKDGLFFQVDGTGVGVVHRRTFDGVTTGPVAYQSSWNRDKLDGTGSSGVTLDVTKNNAYWVEYQHIGGGVLKWGVFAGGEKVTAHEMVMVMDTNALGNPHRPICWAQVNTGTSASTSEMFAYGGSVRSDNTTTNYLEKGDLKTYSWSGEIPANSTSTTYLFTLRPKLLLDNGDENHSYYSPSAIYVTSTDSSLNVDTDVKVEMRIFQKCQMRGLNYQDVYNSTVEIDEDGDHRGHGPELLREVIDGNGDIHIGEYLNKLNNTIHNRADSLIATGTQAFTGITNAAPAILTVSTNPLTQQTKHYFDDLQQITVDDIAETDAAAALNGNSYYMSYVSSNTLALYVNLADLKDDRKTRTIEVDSGNLGLVNVGDAITLDGSLTAEVVAIGASSLTLGNRSSLAIDALSNTTWSTSGSSGTFTTVTLASETAYPKDYDTYLRAVDGSAWAVAATTGNLEGTPPAQPAWTFMARCLSTKSNPTSLRIGVRWKEHVQ